MASFTLTFQDEDGTVTKTFNAVFINEVVDHFDSFIRGCGYVPDGELRIVNDRDDCGALDHVPPANVVFVPATENAGV